jgi:DNA-binding response OmpR family regulator
MSEKKTILIVEDEELMLTPLAEKLSNQGFEVVKAHDGVEGLEKALKLHPDMVILDIVMPKMDGMTVMKKIREDQKWGKDAPIVMLTNLNDPDKVSEAANYNVFDFLVKTDWKLDEVVDFIKQKLEMGFINFSA